MSNIVENKRIKLDIPHLIPPFSGFVEKSRILVSVECGEPLVALNSLITSDSPLVLAPMYFEQGLPNTSENLYLRKGVAEALLVAGNFLPEGHRLIIYDAYRSPEAQQALYAREKDNLRIKNLGLNEAELDKLVQQYVSLPSWDKERPSPHGSGGAVDLSVIKDSGELVDMGTDIDSLDIESQTAHFIDATDAQEKTFHQNRGLLYSVMIEAGFTNYPGEWWHFDKGNRTYAALSGKDYGIYGLPDNPELK